MHSRQIPPYFFAVFAIRCLVVSGVSRPVELSCMKTCRPLIVTQRPSESPFAGGGACRDCAARAAISVLLARGESGSSHQFPSIPSGAVRRLLFRATKENFRHPEVRTVSVRTEGPLLPFRCRPGSKFRKHPLVSSPEPNSYSSPCPAPAPSPSLGRKPDSYSTFRL